MGLQTPTAPTISLIYVIINVSPSSSQLSPDVLTFALTYAIIDALNGCRTVVEHATCKQEVVVLVLFSSFTQYLKRTL